MGLLALAPGYIRSPARAGSRTEYGSGSHRGFVRALPV